MISNFKYEEVTNLYFNIFLGNFSLLSQIDLEESFEQAKSFRRENKIDSSIILFKKIISIESRTNNISELTSGSLNYLGLIANYRNNKKNALDYFYKSIEINKKIDNVSGLVNNYNNLANYYSSDDKKIALEYYQMAIELLSKLKEDRKSAVINMNIGVLYSSNDFERMNYDSAVYYYLNALESFQKVSDSSNLSLLYNNLGFYMKNKKIIPHL